MAKGSNKPVAAVAVQGKKPAQQAVSKATPVPAKANAGAITAKGNNNSNGNKKVVIEETKVAAKGKKVETESETDESEEEEEEELDEESEEGSEEDEEGSDEDDEGEESDEVEASDDEEVEDDDEEDEDDDEDFEQQSSSDEEIDGDDEDDETDEETEELVRALETRRRGWNLVGNERSNQIEESRQDGTYNLQQVLNVDDLSSDDEEDETKNTIGRVPLHWYDAYDHIGYNVSGEKVMRGKGKDRIDMALANHDDPLAARTVYDMYNGREVVLSERDIELIRRIKNNAFAHPEHDSMPDYIDYESSKKEVMPISAAPEPKHRFLPSKWEMMRVMKIVKAMKEGRYIDPKQKKLNELSDKQKAIYMIWNDDEDEVLNDSKLYHLPAPKLPLPGHAESYNPPAEYLLDKNEENPYNYTPAKFSCLRHVPGYGNFMKERYERCLDLYLCPRKLKKRLNIDPETLLPKLPKPRDLKPYPNQLALQYLGHKKPIRSIAISPDGQYLVSASDDCTVRMWDVQTTYCYGTWTFPEPVIQVAWNPNPSHHLFAAITGNQIYFITTGTGDSDNTEVTDSLLAAIEEKIEQSTDGDEEEEEDDAEEEVEEEEEDDGKSKRSRKNVGKWTKPDKETATNNPLKVKNGSHVGIRAVLTLKGKVTAIYWHHKGDYIAALAPSLGSQIVSIHQLSKAKSQCPFTKSPGNVQTVAFHPSRPFIIIATQQHVRIYHLVEQTLMKKLISGCKWISSLDIHPSGDHIIIGSYDRRVVWFDLDLSSTPYKTLKFHEKAVRSVAYHKRYPLMASASDDGTVHVFHATVYNDLSKNPMIVPLKILRGHGVKGDLGVMSIVFHPKQPWIFSSGADGVISLYQDL